MLNTILISEQPQAAATLSSVLDHSDYKVIFEGNSLQQLLSLKWTVEPELIIAVTEKSDSGMLGTFKVINEKFPLPIVIFTEDNRDDAIDQAVEAGISAYVVDGFEPERILPVLKTAVARFQRERSLQTELQELKTALADRKLIDRAKGIIMQQQHCSEDEAYRMLRTSAMNNNMRLADLAKTVLTTADMLATKNSI